MITITGFSGGAEMVRFELGHGQDPDVELARRGWAGPVAAVTGAAPVLTLRYAVAAVPPSAPATDGGGGAAERRAGAPTTARQRLAAYALVMAVGSVLLTELSEAVPGVEGRWTLPGGGVDAGEEPAQAVIREVWEESGQVVTEAHLVRVSTMRRIADPPLGSPASDWPTDFHAVRLLYAARCPDPSPAVVVDVGGSTSEARWVPLSSLGEYAVLPWCRTFLSEQGLLTP